MQTGIAGKVALVTASTQGIGFAVARTLVQEGAEVWVHGRGGQNLTAALKSLRAIPNAGVPGAGVPRAGVNGVAADLTTDEGITTLLQAIPTVDILVNGYADFSPKLLAEVTPADWSAVLRNNVAVTAALGQHYIEGMLRKGWGRVVFISSDLALRPLPQMVPYSAAKMAQLTLMRALAEMTAGTAVTANAVLPGFTRTERTEGYLRWLAGTHSLPFEQFMHDYFHDPAFPYREEVGYASSLVKRLLEPQEVANIIVYLCSALSSATNGASLRCDGGSTLTAL